MKNIFQLILVFAFAMATASTNAQSAKKKVILVNGQPTEVMLSSEGDIQSVERERPDYMTGYVQAPANLNRSTQAVNPVIAEVSSPANTNKTGDFKVSFSGSEIALAEAGAKTLGDVVGNVKTASKGFVLLRTKFDANSSSSNVIAQRRVYACKKFLESKGIAPNKILISLEPGTTTSNDVNVFIR